MRPRTLRRRGMFYRRKRSHWRLNLALVLIGAALTGFVVVGIRTAPPGPGPAENTAKPLAAPTTPAPARTAPTELGSSTLAAAYAPNSAPPPRLAGPGSLLAAAAPDRRAHGEVRGNDAKVTERAPAPRTLVPVVMRSPTGPEGCKTCGDEVPF